MFVLSVSSPLVIAHKVCHILYAYTTIPWYLQTKAIPIHGVAETGAFLIATTANQQHLTSCAHSLATANTMNHHKENYGSGKRKNPVITCSLSHLRRQAAHEAWRHRDIPKLAGDSRSRPTSLAQASRVHPPRRVTLLWRDSTPPRILSCVFGHADMMLLLLPDKPRDEGFDLSVGAVSKGAAVANSCNGFAFLDLLGTR